MSNPVFWHVLQASNSEECVFIKKQTYSLSGWITFRLKMFANNCILLLSTFTYFTYILWNWGCRSTHEQHSVQSTKTQPYFCIYWDLMSLLSPVWPWGLAGTQPQLCVSSVDLSNSVSQTYHPGLLKMYWVSYFGQLNTSIISWYIGILEIMWPTQSLTPSDQADIFVMNIDLYCVKFIQANQAF